MPFFTSSDKGSAHLASGLSERSIKKAKLELGEDVKNRSSAVEKFRSWVLDQPHIKCPTDTQFLLTFLRARKFSQLRSRELLEKYLQRRQKFSCWFQNCNVGEDKWRAVIESGFVLVLPGVDDDGRKVILMRSQSTDTSGRNFEAADVFRTMVGVFDYLLMSDEFQVNGLVEIADLSNTTWQQHLVFSLEDRRDIGQSFETRFPLRTKALHIYNPGAFIDIVLSSLKLIISEKLQRRLTNHGSNLEGLYECVPMRLLPEEYLPDDYTGPNNGSIKQITAQMITEFSRPEVVAFLRDRSSSKYGVDESRRRKDIPPVGSFRKLNVD